MGPLWKETRCIFMGRLNARYGTEFALYPPGDHLFLCMPVAEENQ